MTRKAALLGMSLVVACGGSKEDPDASGDAAFDGAADTSIDATWDASVDAMLDAGLDPCGELVAITHSVEPGDGPDRLGDGDSDGNGISDRDEWGPLRERPLDFDFDGIDDYLDGDDDDDGLLDVYDADRLGASPENDWLADDRIWLDASRVGGLAPNVARPGDTLHIRGEGLGCDQVVSFLGGDTPMNVAPQSADATGMLVIVPEDARGPLAVFRAGDRSNRLPLHVAGVDEPLLDPFPGTVRPGDTLRLTGSGLSEVTSVDVAGAALAPEVVSESEITVSIPLLGATTGLARAHTDAASSNATIVRVVRPVRVSIAGDASGLEVVSATGSATITGADVELEVRANAVALVSALRDDVVELEAIVLPSDDAIELGALSSAIAAAFNGVRAPLVIAEASLVELRTRIGELAEVAALADVIASPPDEIGEELVAAVNAAQQVIDDGIADGSLMSLEPPRMRVVDAEIDPREQQDVELSQIPDTGNVRVTNGTSLFLSARVRDIEEDRIMLQHVVSPFDPLVVPPQSPTVASNTSVDFPRPKTRDSLVQIVTGGVGSPLPSDAFAERTHTLMVLRTVVQEAIAPALSLGLGVDVEADTVVKAMIRHARAEVLAFGAAARTGDLPGASSALVDLVFGQARRLVETGEGSALIMGILQDKVEGAAMSLLLKAASRFVPILGQLKALYDLIATVADTARMIRAANDIIETSATLEFTVIFGLAVTDLEPAELSRGCTGDRLTVVGSNLHPESDGSLPEITVTDPHVLGATSFTVSSGHWRISGDGTEVEIAMPDDFTTIMQGPLEVTVTHRGETLSVPDGIAVSGDPSLSEVMPGVAAEGETIVVHGSGLDEVAALRFIDPTDPTMRAEVTSFTSRSATELELVVPTLPNTNRNWLVQAAAGSGLCEVTSNTVGFATSTAECITAIGVPPSAINNAGVIAGSILATGECYILEPRDGQYFVDDDGDLENDLIVRLSVPDMRCGVAGIADDGTIAGMLTATMGGLAQPYEGDVSGLRPFGTLGDGTMITAMNASGEMVGQAQFMMGPDTVLAAARITTGGATQIHVPGAASSSVARGISDGGIAAGSECCPMARAWLWPGGILPTVGAVAYDVNDSGRVVGTFSNQPVAWDGGVYSELGRFEAGGFGAAVDVNAAGHMVGYASRAFSPQAVLWLFEPAYGLPAGTVDLHPIARANGWAPGTLGRAQAINDVGQIVGGGNNGWVMDMTACE